METNDSSAGPGFRIPLKNSLASAVIVAAATAIFLLAPYNHATLANLYGPPEIAFTGFEFMIFAASAYIALLTAFFFTVGRDTTVSKSLRFITLAIEWSRAPIDSCRRGVSREDRVAVLSTLLKSFYGPMMVLALMTFCLAAWSNGAAIIDVGLTGLGPVALFDRFGYWFILQIILFIDVLVFTVGYLVESSRLGNEIRSVDPTLVGWIAALACYPPFNFVSSRLLGSTVSDFPQFDDPTIHMALNITLLVLMAVYASASAALGLKASNLTHRGIIARGPYAVIRHPAYLCKNLAWWIGSVPVIVAALDESLQEGLKFAGSMAAWTGLYVLRALTEEDHLRSVDGEYAAYAEKVRYRFIPGVH